MARKQNDSQNQNHVLALEMQVLALDRLLTSELTSLSDRVKLALDGAARAIEKAEAANEKRFDSVNEFRAVLADQQRTLTSQTAFQAFQDQSSHDRQQLHDFYQELRVAMGGLVTKSELDAQLSTVREKTDALGTAVSRQLILSLSTVVAILIAALITLATRGHA